MSIVELSRNVETSNKPRRSRERLDGAARWGIGRLVRSFREVMALAHHSVCATFRRGGRSTCSVSPTLPG